MIINDSTELARIVFDGNGSKRKSLYVYGEVYIPYFLYEENMDEIEDLVISVSDLEGEYVETIAKFKCADKMTLKDIIEHEDIVEHDEDISEWAVEFVEFAFEEKVENFQTMRLLHKVLELKKEYSNESIIDEEMIIPNALVDGNVVTVRLPKGTCVSVVNEKGLSIEDVNIEYKMV